MHCEQEDAALAALEAQMEVMEINDEREELEERKKAMLEKVPEAIKYLRPGIHEVALIEPWWLPKDLVDLALDIEEKGQLYSIQRLDGIAAEIYGKGIIDGKNRLVACSLLGIECREEIVTEIPGGSLLDYTKSHNDRRRHLTTGQRADLARKFKEEYKKEAEKRQRYNLKIGSKSPERGHMAPLGQNAQDRLVDAKSDDSGDTESSMEKGARRAGSTVKTAKRSEALYNKCIAAGHSEIYERTLLPDGDPQQLTITAAGRLLKETVEKKAPAKKSTKKSSKKAVGKNAKKTVPRTLEDCIQELLDITFEEIENWKQPSDWRTLAPKGLKDILANARNLSFALKSWQDPGKCPVCNGKKLEETGSDKKGVKAHCTHCGGYGRAGKQWKPIDN